MIEFTDPESSSSFALLVLLLVLLLLLLPRLLRLLFYRLLCVVPPLTLLPRIVFLKWVFTSGMLGRLHFRCNWFP